MRRVLALLLVLCCGSAGAEEPVKASVRVDVQVVAIDTKLAITLIPELKLPETADRAIEKIQAMIEDETAELLAWPCATAASGGRATSEGGEELRFPDYSPPLPSRGTGSEWAPPAVKTYQLPYYQEHNLGLQTPTEFEVRNLEPMLEFGPIMTENGSNIVLDILIGDVEFEGFKELRGTPSKAGIAGTMVFADVRSRRMPLGLVNVQPGKRMLLSSFVEQRPKPRVILYLLRARVIGDNTSIAK
jgi:hypothetical protein